MNMFRVIVFFVLRIVPGKAAPNIPPTINIGTVSFIKNIIEILPQVPVTPLHIPIKNQSKIILFCFASALAIF